MAATDSDEIGNTGVMQDTAAIADQASYGEQRIGDWVPDILVGEIAVDERPVTRRREKIGGEHLKEPSVMQQKENLTVAPPKDDARTRTEETVMPTRQSARLVGKRRVNYRAVPYSFHTSVKKGLKENGAAAYDAIKKVCSYSKTRKH